MGTFKEPDAYPIIDPLFCCPIWADGMASVEAKEGGVCMNYFTLHPGARVIVARVILPYSEILHSRRMVNTVLIERRLSVMPVELPLIGVH